MSTKTKKKGNGSIYMNSLITLREEHRYMNYKGVPYYLLALSKRKWKNNNIWPSCRDIPRPVCYVGACCAMQNSTELEQIGNIYSKRIFLAHIITNSSANG